MTMVGIAFAFAVCSVLEWLIASGWVVIPLAFVAGFALRRASGL